MKFRTFLLGTTTAFAVAGGADAADLAVAEAIDYVKVCDAYGTGYHYIPGTDTCLSVGGYLRVDVWGYNTDKVGNVVGLGVNVPDPGSLPADVPMQIENDSYASYWEFKSRVNVNFTARTMSDLGPVVTYFNFVADSHNDTSDLDLRGIVKTVLLDNIYGSIDPLLFGWTQSTFDYVPSFTYDGYIRSDLKTDQIRWSYSLGSWGIMGALEDPRDRYFGAKNATGDFPDLILAITGGGGGWDWKASAAVTDRTSGTGWGALLGITGNLGGGFKIRAQGAYADNFRSLVGGGNGLDNCTNACDDGAWWSAILSASAAISNSVSAAATVSYADGPVNGDEQWQAAVGAYWAATSTSEIGLEFLYKGFGSAGPDDNWGIHGRFKTQFGG